MLVWPSREANAIVARANDLRVFSHVYISAENYQAAWMGYLWNSAEAIELRSDITGDVPAIDCFIDSFGEIRRITAAHGWPVSVRIPAMIMGEK